jgi:hypothetical protein
MTARSSRPCYLCDAIPLAECPACDGTGRAQRHSKRDLIADGFAFAVPMLALALIWMVTP